jgi:hypothetical protein
MTMAAIEYAATGTTEGPAGIRRAALLAIVALTVAVGFVASGSLAQTSRSVPQHAASEQTRADPTARLGVVSAPDADFVELAHSGRWIFGASAAGGSVCNVLRVVDGGSGSACGNPTEVEAVMLGFSDVAAGKVLSGTTVGSAASVVFEFRDGHAEEVQALHHPGLPEYSFFVAPYSSDIVGVAAHADDGTEVARASAQTLRFITEGDLGVDRP